VPSSKSVSNALGSARFEELFGRTVRQDVEAGLVDWSTLQVGGSLRHASRDRVVEADGTDSNGQPIKDWIITAVQNPKLLCGRIGSNVSAKLRPTPEAAGDRSAFFGVKSAAQVISGPRFLPFNRRNTPSFTAVA